MSFNHLKYDGCAYDKAVRQSTAPVSYMLGPPKVCDPCFPETPFIRLAKSGSAICEDKALVDVDSELIGLNVKRTHCPEKEYKPTKEGFCKLKTLKDCNTGRFFNSEPTRFSNPVCTLRGTGWNRWEWLCEDPQKHAFNITPFERMANSQIMAKDNHRACLPHLMDQIHSMPQYDPRQERTQPYTYKYTPVHQFYEHNNLRTCEEISRL